MPQAEHNAPTHVVRLGTRSSILAITQSQLVAAALEAAANAGIGGIAGGAGNAGITGGTERGVDTAAARLRVELVQISTVGDRSTAPIEQLGGTGVFVTAVREALLDGRCDVAVHSLKDLPTGAAAGLTSPVVPPRADPRDALCARDGLDLAGLPEGAVVGTGSPRRRAALLAARPDLRVVGLRGNVDSRLGRVGADLDAVVLAVAGLERIGRLGDATELLSATSFPPAPGQGALAVETRADLDPASPFAIALANLEDPHARAATIAERAVLARLEAGCTAPVGALGTVASGRLSVTASAFAPDGQRRIDASGGIDLDNDAPRSVRDADAFALGARLAVELLDRGAAALTGLA